MRWRWATKPRYPDFTALGILVDGATTTSGFDRVPKFTSRVASKQKEQAEIYKQRLLHSEEQSNNQNAVDAPPAGPPRATKPKAKNKQGAGG